MKTEHKIIMAIIITINLVGLALYALRSNNAPHEYRVSKYVAYYRGWTILEIHDPNINKGVNFLLAYNNHNVDQTISGVDIPDLLSDIDEAER